MSNPSSPKAAPRVALPSDIVRALDALEKYNPDLVKGVFEILQSRIGAVSDKDVLIRQEGRKEKLDHKNFIKGLVAYGVLLAIALILLLVAYWMEPGKHPVEVAGLFGPSLAAVAYAVLYPKGKGKNQDK
jgi:hypothetical protein